MAVRSPKELDSRTIKELYSKTIWSAIENNRTDFRLIQYVNKEGEPIIKFGFSELYFCKALGRWLPSKKHHVYLPLSAWSEVEAQKRVVESAIEKQSQTR